ncbi:MAG: cytochrome c [Thermoanaerobaculia bacterium]
MRKFLKWIGISLATVVGAILVLVAVLVFLGGRKLSAIRTVAVEPVAVPGDPAAIERGAHLVRTRCVFCHGDDLGGKKFIDDPSFMVLNAPNLTRGSGGLGGSYVDDAAWVRALRHGVNPHGRALVIMPAEVYYYLSDGDLGDLISYLKTLTPVDRSWPAPQPGIVAKALFGAGKLDNMLAYLTTDHQAARPPKPEPGANAEYGEYIVRTFGCRNCHGPELSGQQDPGNPAMVAPNITPGGSIADWSEDDFRTMIQEQDSKDMPWAMLRAMTVDEQRALYRYLKSVPARVSTGQMPKA